MSTPQPLRLTLINQFYLPDISPTAHLCASLAEHRALLGDRVTMLTSRAGYLAGSSHMSESATDRFGARGALNVRRLWSTRFGSRSNLGRLLDWITFFVSACWTALRIPPQDLVIALTTPPFIALAGWLHKLRNPRCRLFLWNMDTYPEALERTALVRTSGIISTVMRSANRAIFRRLDHLICLDSAMEDLLLSQYTPPGRTLAHTIIPNWERADLFPLVEQQQGPRTDVQFVLLYLGNAGYGHDFSTILQAAEALRDEAVSFLFVGGGPLQAWIASEAERRGLRNMDLRDYVPKHQTPQLMAQADCALITLEDPMAGVMSPSKLHANLAMGLPIVYIGPAGSNVDEAIARSGCGVSLRPGDCRGVVDFVRSQMRDRQLHVQFRQRARAAFETHYCDLMTLPMFDRIIDAAPAHGLG